MVEIIFMCRRPESLHSCVVYCDVSVREMSFAWVGFGGLGMLQPNRLPGKTKAAMTVIVPTGVAREMVEFLERKRALGRGARVVPSHRLAKDRGGEQIDAEFRKPAPAHIGDQHFPMGKGAATTQRATDRS